MRTLAAHLAGDIPLAQRSIESRERRLAARNQGGTIMKNSAIAIVGMAGRFPGLAMSTSSGGTCATAWSRFARFRTPSCLPPAFAPEDLARPDYVKAAAVLDDVDMFDASFFGFSPRDAAIMDPQHRHFLECAWEAIENAGHSAGEFSGSIGVFAGSGMNAYMIHNLLNNRSLMESAGLFLIRQTGNDKDVLATRVSYQLDLRGPSLTVQTACSTSLVAVHLACQSLLDCECDMALAGGVTIEIPHAQGYVYREGEILSRDGHCRAFDAASSGTVFSSGVGIVVLRRLDDAIADRDTIHAVILGSAVNNDGQRKVGYLAPSVAGQAEVIAEALGVAGVECGEHLLRRDPWHRHRGWRSARDQGPHPGFSRETDRKGFCAIGSAEDERRASRYGGRCRRTDQDGAGTHSIGNCLPASTSRAPIPRSILKTVRSMSTVALRLGVTGASRAGVTSLGIGGTNAHVVLEEAPERRREWTHSPQLIPLVSPDGGGLEDAGARLAAYLVENRDRGSRTSLSPVRSAEKRSHRRFVVATTAGSRSLLAAPETLAASRAMRRRLSRRFCFPARARSTRGWGPTSMQASRSSATASIGARDSAAGFGSGLAGCPLPRPRRSLAAGPF